MKGGVALTAATAADPTTIAAVDVATSTIFRYVGDYLNLSATVIGQASALAATQIIQSLTQYDGTSDQKLVYTWNMKGGVALTAATASDPTTIDAVDVATSTIFRYVGDYLNLSATVIGQAIALAATQIIQSLTKYDGTRDQKLVYTWNMKGGVLLTAALIADLTSFLAADIATSTIFKYSGDYLDVSVTVKGKHIALAVGAEVQSLTKYDGTRDQKLVYTWNMKGGVLLTAALIADLTSFLAADIATSTIFKYSGDYLDVSVTVKGKHVTLVVGAEVQSLTKYDGTRDQKLVYTWNMKGGVLLTAALIADLTSFLAADIATSTIFKYSGDYLDVSVTVKGKHVTLVVGAEVQSLTKYDGTRDQKLVYTWNMKGGVLLTAALIADLTSFLAADIATSTIFKYSGDYLDVSVTVKGKHIALAVGAEVQSLTKYDGTRDQKLVYTWNMKGGVLLTAALIADLTTFLAADISTSTLFRYTGDYLDVSVTVKGKYVTLTVGAEVQSLTKYDGTRDQKLVYTWNMKGGVLLTAALIADLTSFLAADIATSTIFKYSGDYLDVSVTVKGKHIALAVGAEVQSLTKYDGTRDQKLVYTWNMKGGVLLTAALIADLTTFLAADISTSTLFRYTGDYLDVSVTVKGKYVTLTVGAEVQSLTK